MKAGVASSKQKKQLLLFVGISTLFALILCCSAIFAGLLRNGPAGFGALFWEISGAYLWVAFAPLIFVMLRRYPLNGARFTRSLIAHFLASLVFACLHLWLQTLVTGFVSYLMKRPMPAVEGWMVAFCVYRLSWRIAMYAFLVLVSQSFVLYRRSQRGEARKWRLENRVARARLRGLRAQTHPEFLLTALSKTAKLVSTDVRVARKLLVRLGDYLRLLLGKPAVRVDAQIARLKAYIKVREIINRNLRIRVRTQPGLLNKSAPNLLLEPLIEKILHARMREGRSYALSISLGRCKAFLEIQLADNHPAKNGAECRSAIEEVLSEHGMANYQIRLAPENENKFHLSIRVPLARSVSSDRHSVTEAKESSNTLARRTVFASWITLAWMLATLFLTARENLLFLVGQGATMPPANLLVFNISWIAWAAITPAIVLAIKHYPLQRPGVRKHLLMHLFFSAGCSGLVIFITAVARWWILFDQQNFIRSLLITGMRPELPIHFLIYWSILLGVFALRYYRTSLQSESEMARLKLELSQAQLHALRMQLHPHFLFNTLHSISALIDEDATAAQKMVIRLKSFLEQTLLSSEKQQISFHQELQFVQCYMDIERVRLEERLSVDIDIDAGTLGVPVPNLLLQPIVENAIRHGIATSARPGVLHISARCEKNVLRIEVRDTGPGFRRNRNNKGVGITNTRQRLKHLYGTAHSFVLENIPGGGTCVKIGIPAFSVPL